MAGGDDFSADFRTTGRIAIGATSAGRIDQAQDQDWFRVSLKAGERYAFTLYGAADGLGTLAPGANLAELTVYDSMGAAQTGNRDDGATGRADMLPWLSFAPQVSGDYYIALKGNTAGTYHIGAAAIVDDYDTRFGIHSNDVLTPGTVLAGRFDYSGDGDEFKVPVLGGHIYQLSLTADGPGQAPLDLGADVASYFGVALGSNDAVSTINATSAERVFAAGSDGNVHVTVSNSGAPKGYQVVVTDLGKDDYGSQPDSTAGTLTAGSTISGLVQLRNDVDAFQLVLEPGVSYVITGSGKLADSGTLALGTWAQDHTYMPNLYVTPGFNSNTHVYVSSVGQSGAYTLRATPAADDYTANAATSGKLLPGQGVAGVLATEDDRDWFAVAMQAGETYAFSLSGGAQTSAQQLDLQLVDANGTVLAYSHALGISQYTPQTSGTAYIEVRGSGRTDVVTQSPQPYTVRLLGDEAPPSVIGTALSGLDRIVVTFNEPVVLASLDGITLKSSTGQAFALLSGSTNGDALTLQLAAPLPLGATVGLTLTAASVTDTSGNRHISNDTEFLLDTPASIGTRPGDDMYYSHGAGRFDGGDGMDAMYYESPVQVTRDGAGFKVQIVGATTFPDTIVNIERIVVRGQQTTIALDIDGIGGSVYRLYQSAFNRKPDLAGVGYWIYAMEHGATLHDVAAGFIASKEFASLYGSNPGNAAFVDHLYQNVLHRRGEDAGVTYWNDVLARGGSRTDVLVNFSESQENRAEVAKVIGNGFEYIPYS